MSDTRINTIRAVRESFWRNHTRLVRIPGKTQNDYPCDTRMAFCDYVETLRRDGDITERLAYSATL